MGEIIMHQNRGRGSSAERCAPEPPSVVGSSVGVVRDVPADTAGTAIGLGPEEQLARDWALFQSVESGTAEGLIRCWQPDRVAVVIGRNGRVAADVIEEACVEDGVTVLRRGSGGGAVVLGPGCLAYVVVMSLASWPELTSVAASFRCILERVVAALDVPGLSIAGGTDLALGGRKVSGNAQRRGRRALMHHGTLLFDFDPRLATRYLKEPVRQPAYRMARPHAAFLGNVPLAAESIRARMEAAWSTVRLKPWLKPDTTYGSAHGPLKEP